MNFAVREVSGKLKNDLNKRIYADRTTSIFIKQMASKCQKSFTRRKEEQNGFLPKRDLLWHLNVPHAVNCFLHFFSLRST